MARENHVRLSDREQALLEEVRQTEFGTDSVPLGEAVEAACEQYLGQQRLEAADLDDS
jgi:hypothetical protein